MDSPKRGREHCVISLGCPEPVRSVMAGLGRASVCVGGGRIGSDRRALESELRGPWDMGMGVYCVEEGMWHMRFGACVQHDVGG